jgi:NitT/TauT family transport system substrate-binding protein
LSIKHLVSAALLAGLSFAACGPRAQPAEAPAKDVVTLNYQPYISFGAFFVGEEEGCFAEQGLELRYVPVARSMDSLSAVAQGDLDVLSGYLSIGLLNAIASGAQIRMVADKGHVDPARPPQAALLVRRALAEKGVLEKPEKLRGLRLALDYNVLETMMTERALARAGLTLDDMEIVKLPPAGRITALANGTVDISLEGEPWIARALKAGSAVIWLTDNDLIPGYQCFYVAFGPSLLRDRPEVGRRFMIAYLKSVRRYNQGKTDANVEVVARRTKLDPDLVRQAGWPAIRSDGMIEPQSILEFQNWAFSKGLLNRKLETDEFWDPSFAQHADRLLNAGQPSVGGDG